VALIKRPRKKFQVLIPIAVVRLTVLALASDAVICGTRLALRENPSQLLALAVPNPMKN
jgi:hypothetical protein